MDSINFELIGDDMQAVVIKMKNGQTIRAEAGAMMFMDSGIDMDANLDGGLLGGIKRKLTGESFMIPHFNCQVPDAEIAFAGPYPGKIIHMELTGNSILCQKDAFLCCHGDIDLSIALTRKLGAGFFGGEGFILQKISGSGLCFLHAGGTIVEKELVSGETLKVDTGCLVGFDESVTYDIKMVKGVKTMFFGGEGLFLAHLSGPGKVWLQTLPFSRLADRITSAKKSSTGEKRRGSAISGMLGDLISGD
jgi:uncharacterized protein (TIGR00266 family)